MENSSVFTLPILLTLIMVTSAVAIAVKWVKLPYAIALVLVGLLIGVFHLLPSITMTPELILVIFLPAILFEASWNLDLRSLKESFKPVFAFATVGVLISTAAIGLVLHYWTGMEPLTALLFGAMVSATDPISVLSLFKRMGIETRLTTILEGESLLNDGTALVLFRLLLTAILAGSAVSWVNMGSEFLVVTLGGTIIGAAIGFGCSVLTRYFDDHLLEITLTVLLAYGSYLLAEQFHVSAVIAVLVAGMLMGTFGSKTGMSSSTRLAVNAFWEYAAFLAESLVFLLIGMQIKLPLLLQYAPMVGVAIVAILVGRFLLIYGIAPLVSSKKKPIPLSWRHLLFWGGLRGSLCMAMALSLPTNFPGREQLIVMAFGVALFTLFVQGLSIEPLVYFLKIKREHSELPKYRTLMAEIGRAKLAIQKLNESYDSKKILKKDFTKQKKALEEKIEETEKLIIKLRDVNVSIELVETIQAERAMIEAQKDCLNRLSREHTVSDAVIAGLRTKLDEQMLSVYGDEQIETPPLAKDLGSEKQHLV
jgi:monovalent cation:H+ antiporter, CPA1 family